MDGFLYLYVFILAAFTGYEIIGRVPVILHTPLMSGSNFVHGIVLVGAMVALSISPIASRRFASIRQARRSRCWCRTFAVAWILHWTSLLRHRPT